MSPIPNYTRTAYWHWHSWVQPLIPTDDFYDLLKRFNACLLVPCRRCHLSPPASNSVSVFRRDAPTSRFLAPTATGTRTRNYHDQLVQLLVLPWDERWISNGERTFLNKTRGKTRREKYRAEHGLLILFAIKKRKKTYFSILSVLSTD